MREFNSIINAIILGITVFQFVYLACLMVYFITMGVHFAKILNKSPRDKCCCRCAGIVFAVSLLTLVHLATFSASMLLNPFLYLNVNYEWIQCTTTIININMVAGYLQAVTPFITSLFLICFVNFLVTSQLRQERDVESTDYLLDSSFDMKQGGIEVPFDHEIMSDFSLSSKKINDRVSRSRNSSEAPTSKHSNFGGKTANMLMK